MDSPAWDPAIIARDPSGELTKGGIWGGGQSYTIGPAQYVRTSAFERIRRTLTIYPIEKTYHIDVLSAVPVRYDYREDHPASALEDLKGKWQIIDEFRRHGVDVTSEGMTGQFVGHIGHAWHLMRGRDTVYPVEERIPLIPFMYHGKITWGGSNAPEYPPVIDALHYGATYGFDLTKQTPDNAITDVYYLIALPASMLRAMPMVKYDDQGVQRTVYYSKDTFVEINEQEKRYRVVLNGRQIAKDYTVWIPVAADTSMVYGRSTGEIRYPSPAGWTDSSRISAQDLITDKPADIHVRVESGWIIADTEGGHPYRVTYQR
jgi:hypothetical protein